jgi:hypothetical protein
VDAVSQTAYSDQRVDRQGPLLGFRRQAAKRCQGIGTRSLWIDNRQNDNEWSSKQHGRTSKGKIGLHYADRRGKPQPDRLSRDRFFGSSDLATDSLRARGGWCARGVGVGTWMRSPRLSPFQVPDSALLLEVRSTQPEAYVHERSDGVVGESQQPRFDAVGGVLLGRISLDLPVDQCLHRRPHHARHFAAERLHRHHLLEPIKIPGRTGQHGCVGALNLDDRDLWGGQGGLIALCLLTGNVGRRGTGLHPLRGQNNVQGACDAGLIPMVYPDYQPVRSDTVRVKFEAAWGVRLDPQPGLTVVEIIAAAREGRIRGMLMMGENPFLSDPNVNKVRQALARLEFLAVQDIFLTETAEFADVILPSASFFEKTGSYTNTDHRVPLGRRVLDAPRNTGCARNPIV